MKILIGDNECMKDLYYLLFEKGLVAKVLDALRQKGLPDPATDASGTLLYSHALSLYGDYQQAYKIYSSIPPNPIYEAERLSGMANTLFRMGDLRQAKLLLGRALKKHPSNWLLTRIYNIFTGLYLYEGRIDKAIDTIDKGMEIARKEPNLAAFWIFEGNRGVVKMYQGRYEEAFLIIRKAVDQLLCRDCILSAATSLINLSSVVKNLNRQDEVQKCLKQAEVLIMESGTKSQLIFLKWAQGHHLEREGFFDKAKQAYEASLEILQEFPDPTLDAQISCDLAQLYFKKGDSSSALSLVRTNLARIREKGLRFLEDRCLVCEGKFLLRSGATREGIIILNQACRLAESMGKGNISEAIALHLALGYWELKERRQAIEWLQRCFQASERALPALLEEREILVPLLLGLIEELPLTDFLSKLVVQLRHPAVLKRLMRHSPEGKLLFLRSLKVDDARHYRPLLEKLRNDPDKEVRRNTRSLIHRWHHYTGYRVYTLGTFRCFQEGKLFSEEAWIRPGVKRLFLYLLTKPEEWHSTESLLEALWTNPSLAKTTKVLNTLFSYLRCALEPWHLPGADYVFFRSQRHAYGFFPGERIWIDFQEFLEGIKRGEDAQRSRHFKEARQAYREALALYLGDYIRELPYEDWLNDKRDQLRESYFRLALKYAILEQESGNLSEARRVLEEALYKDLSRSACAALLIRILAGMQLPQEAWNWGQRHLTYIKKELRVKPTPEVLEAISRIKKEDQ